VEQEGRLEEEVEWYFGLEGWLIGVVGDRYCRRIVVSRFDVEMELEVVVHWQPVVEMRDSERLGLVVRQDSWIPRTRAVLALVVQDSLVEEVVVITVLVGRFALHIRNRKPMPPLFPLHSPVEQTEQVRPSGEVQFPPLKSYTLQTAARWLPYRGDLEGVRREHL
jgi:hypothetical protein